MQDLLTVQRIPRSRDDVRFAVQTAQQLDRLCELFFACILRAAENNGTCIFDLIAEEFAEVFQIHFAFLRIDNGGKTVERDVVAVDLFNGMDDVAEFAHAGGLDDDAVGGEFVQNLGERLLEVADQATANASGIHFGDLNAGVLQKSAVDADLAEFVFDQNDFFAAERFAEQLFDQSGFSGTEEAGDNINFCHRIYLLSFLFQLLLL